MILEYYTKNVYGNELIYPANEVAMLFCRLTNTKTLSNHALYIAEQLGFKITRVLK